MYTKIESFRSSIIRLCLPVVIFLTLVGNSTAEPRIKIQGTPVYQQFPIQRQLGESKVRKIIQNPANFIITLAGNSILVFDGERWTKIQIPGIYHPDSIINRKAGGFWISGYHDAGHLILDEHGRWNFTSMKKALPEALRDLPNWKVLLETADGTVYVSIGSRIIALNESKALQIWDNIGHVSMMHQSRGKLFCITDYPIVTELLPEGRFRRITRQSDTLQDLSGAYGSTLNSDGDLMISTKEFGIVRFDGESYETVLPGSFFKNGDFPKEIIQTESGEYFVGLEKGGYLQFTDNAEVFSQTQQIEEFRLSEAKCFHVDHQGGLWFSQKNRIFRLDLRANAEVFNANHGLNGEVYTISEYKKRIYFGTEQSLYRFNPGSRVESEMFDRLDGPIHIQTLLTFMGNLFIGASNGLFSWDGEKMVQYAVGDYQQLAVDPGSPNRLFSAGSSGFVSVEFDADNSPVVHTISGSIFGYGLVADKNQLWIGLGQAKVGRYNPEDPSAGVKIYDQESGVANTWTAPFLLNGNIYINGEDHIRKYDEASDSWTRDDSIKYFPGDSQGLGFMLSVRDANGKDWVNASVSPTQLMPLGNMRMLPLLYQLNSDTDEKVKAYFRDSNGDLWMARGVSCIRIKNENPVKNFSHEARPPIVVRILDANTGDLIAQNYLDSLETLELSSGQNSLEFQLGSMDFGTIGQNIYMVQLDGYHKTEQTFRPGATRVFTNLHHGNYSLRWQRQTKDFHFSKEKTLTFHIPAPLHLQWWAKLLYFLGFIGIFYVIYDLRVRTIQLSNLQLEKVVKDRTRELQQSELNYKLLFNSSADYYLVSSYVDGKICTIDNANTVVFEKIISSTEKLRNRKLRDLLSPGTRKVFEEIEKDLKLRLSSDREAELQTEAGERIPVEIHSQVYDRGDGKFVLSAARDITKRLESEKLKEDVHRITAHDIKSPILATISLPEIMLEEDNLNETQREYLKIISDSGQKVLDMINRTLDLYKMERGAYEYTPATFDLHRLFNHLKTYLNPLVGNAEVELDFSINTKGEDGEDHLQICAGELLLSSAISNLVKNAIEASIKATPSKVEVTVDRQQDWWVIRVKNEQCVAPDIRDRFFEKYATSGKFSGTGLGTYSAKLMVETMKGEITMESDESFGTIVSIRLPVNP